MKRSVIPILTLLVCFVGATAVQAQQTLTPDDFVLTFHRIELSTDGTNWVTVIDSASGISIDITDPASLNGALGSGGGIPAGDYTQVRFTLNEQISYVHNGQGLSGSQIVQGMPAGAFPNTFQACWATAAEGGLPMSDDPDATSGDGTPAAPFLFPQAISIVSGGTTNLNMIIHVTDTLYESSPGVWELGPPQMFLVANNGDASALNGNYRIVLYNTEVAFDSNGVKTEWETKSGWGVLSFDGAGGWSYAGTLSRFDLLAGSGSQDPDNVSGSYGVNLDGSIWMVVSGTPGTVRGAIQLDGDVFVGSMIDSPTAHMVIWGVREATSASDADLNGDYYFTGYGDEYNIGDDSLRYQGMFAQVSFDGAGHVSGTSDQSSVDIMNAVAGPQTSAGPVAQLADPIVDTYAVQPNGTINTAGGEAIGAGTVTITMIEHYASGLSETTQQFVYTVDSATGIVTIDDPNNSEPVLAAIGPNGDNLILLRPAESSPGVANDGRFLGLAVRQ